MVSRCVIVVGFIHSKAIVQIKVWRELLDKRDISGLKIDSGVVDMAVQARQAQDEKARYLALSLTQINTCILNCQ